MYIVFLFRGLFGGGGSVNLEPSMRNLTHIINLGYVYILGEGGDVWRSKGALCEIIIV